MHQDRINGSSNMLHYSNARSDGFHSNFKNFLRSRKIMVMHSNERGECCLRTLIDRSGSVDAT